MKPHLKIFRVLMISPLIFTGCASLQEQSALIPPVGTSDLQNEENINSCFKGRGVYLSNSEVATLLKGRYTGGFTTGYGGSNASDRYVACLLKKDYQWITYRNTSIWPPSICDILGFYKQGGIEPDRLADQCKGHEECEVCIEKVE